MVAVVDGSAQVVILGQWDFSRSRYQRKDWLQMNATFIQFKNDRAVCCFEDYDNTDESNQYH